MPLHPHDDPHLERALSLARDAIGLASPNPTVGCVLVRGDTVLGQGAHVYDLRDHAEIAALKQAAALGNSVKNSTAYVTLEPCAHHGRTPPCADALIAAGIARCVIATLDPNPLVSGQGLAKLRAANIATLLLDPTSPPAQEARRLNEAFAFSIQHHRPFVTLKAALSVDGMLAPPPNTRTTTAPHWRSGTESSPGDPVFSTSNAPHWLTGPAARADVHLLRHASDALLTGIGTILADNPSLTDRSALPRRGPLLRIVLDTHLRTPLTSKLVQSAANDLLILCSPTAPTAKETALTSAGAEVLRIPTAGLPAILTLLAARHITSLLLEAGPTLNGAFLRANLVDKLILYYSETELGLDALPFAHGIPSPYVLQQTLTSITRATFPHQVSPRVESQDIRITGYLHDPWSAVL
jgi:diaminohydroxyphosphoribosylaminopyrimidine deaminase / 5-amino-6-(5-phosphoribosylamino)uracil reductase